MKNSNKNKKKKYTGAYATFPLFKAQKHEPKTNVTIPSNEAVEEARQFIEENKK